METRLWNSDTGETASMRSKEDAHDYRYFPEPDLAPLVVSSAWIDQLRRGLPELPEARKARLAATHSISAYDADVLVRLPGAVAYFEAMIAAGAPAKAASNWIQGEVRRKLKDLGRDDLSGVPMPAAALAELATLTDTGVISSSVAKDVFEEMWTTGRGARAIVDAKGLAQVGDTGALTAMVHQVVSDHPDAVAQYRSGRTATFGFLVGQVMKASCGKANPKIVSELLRAALGPATSL
jgi:aspartyl-tRNA(Asn)/glutamyl-tRNA(Gln) amidotransferase subunit B